MDYILSRTTPPKGTENHPCFKNIQTPPKLRIPKSMLERDIFNPENHWDGYLSVIRGRNTESSDQREFATRLYPISEEAIKEFHTVTQKVSAERIYAFKQRTFLKPRPYKEAADHTQKKRSFHRINQMDKSTSTNI
ncbi:MAG: hypothetical protein S4CHLAM20_14570 [Chlamydiia bacterium]|nr:hypothetical protein [Chlamydiia bacterium]